MFGGKKVEGRRIFSWKVLNEIKKTK